MMILYAHPRWRKLAAVLVTALLGALLAACGAVKPAPPEAAAPPSHSVPEADARLAQVGADKARTEAAFAADEQHCYTRFMVNNCLDKAREKRREALAGLRAIEIEADRFKRQAKVDERDRELARAQADFQAQEARMMAAPPPPPPPPPPRALAPPSPPAAKPAVVRDRAADQAAKLKNLEARDQAGAAKRAANVQAFEKRKRDSEQRQKEIAEKKKKAISEGEAP